MGEITVFIEDATFVELISAEEIALVQSTFKMVVPIADTAAELFYGRLFEIDPALKPMFKGDMKEQGRKLMHMLSIAVAGLDDLDRLVPAVQALGRRHVGYGVRDAHYATVGSALLWTLEQARLRSKKNRRAAARAEVEPPAPSRPRWLQPTRAERGTHGRTRWSRVAAG